MAEIQMIFIKDSGEEEIKTYSKNSSTGENFLVELVKEDELVWFVKQSFVFHQLPAK